MKFTDAVSVAGTRRTNDGYLIAEARSVRTGIQLYAGHEVGRPDMPVVRVHRDASEVFAQDSLQSFSHAPVTLDHPSEAVTAENWKELSVGEVSTAAKQDGEWVMLPLVLKDAQAIESVASGKRQLSAGYSCELDWTPGMTADGEYFDAQQKGIKINHLAIVDQARAGSNARIGDDAAKWGVSPVNTPADHGRKVKMTDTLRKVMVDGLQVETTDAGAQAIDKLQKDAEALQTKLSDAEKAHKDAIEAKDKELAKKDAEIDDLKGKVLDEAALDAKVAERADLITKAKAIAPDIKTDGVADADIRKAAVVAKLGDAAIKDKQQAYIDARFDILAEDIGGDDKLRDAITHLRPSDGVTDAAKLEQDAYQASVDRFNRKKKSA